MNGTLANLGKLLPSGPLASAETVSKPMFDSQVELIGVGLCK